MRHGRSIVSGMIIAMVGIAASASPVMAGRGGSEMGPPAFDGVWQPVVGSGAVYDVQQAGEPAMVMEMDVVGQEAGGYWVETRMTQPGEMTSKMLMVEGAIKRMIVKSGADPAMEMPAMMLQPSGPQTDLKDRGTLIGTESITTDAGTFMCEHYRVGTGGEVSDAWINATISPYGLVKMSKPGMTLLLTRVVTGATTRITEEPMTMPDLSNLR